MFHVQPAKQLVVANELFPNPYVMSRLTWRQDSRTISMLAADYVSIQPPSWGARNCHRVTNIGQLGRDTLPHYGHDS